MSTAAPTLKAPFPWFGGKSLVAGEIWNRFGKLDNYVEPFCGSCAVLLGNPHRPKTETVNDADAHLANFWRAVKHDPAAVAEWADHPVSELDLHARGDWLFYRADAATFAEQLRANPDFFCPKSAGWWVWGQCAWIGSGWGGGGEKVARQLPHLSGGRGVNRQLPHLGNAGRGVNRQLPHLGNAGRGVNRATEGSRGDYILGLMEELCARLRDVRVACGDWTRVLGPSVTIKHGMTGILLDPPYDPATNAINYGGKPAVWQEVTRWCEENGDNPKLRIALCGYAGTWEPPGNWATWQWKARGGFGSQGEGRGRENATRETIWFSPACLNPEQMLF